jgi:hypothetical protein
VRRLATLAALAAAVGCAGVPAARRPGGPWDQLAGADAAERALDPQGEARALLAILDTAPRHPLAVVAVRRLSRLAELAPPIAREVDAGLTAALPRLEGLAAFRARAARAAIAEARGEPAAGAALRAENGAVGGWTLVGPLGAHHALELDRPFAPEAGALPARTAGAPGVGEVAARVLPAPEGHVALEGEPLGADVYYLAADVTLARGGEYLAVLGSSSSYRAWLDGAPLAERRAHEGWLAQAQAVPRRIAPGTHRLLVKLARGSGRGNLSAALARQDGAASDARSEPARAGDPSAAVAAAPFPAPAHGAADLAQALERDGEPALARLVAARDAAEVDREGAKRLLAAARALGPPPAALDRVEALVVEGDPTLPERTARARAEAALARAVARDPGDAAARLALARLALDGERVDDALAQLEALPPAARALPLAALVRARAEKARGFAAGAERQAELAHRELGLCDATELLFEAAGQRGAAGLQDELAQALARCAGGARRLAEHLRRRGDVRAAVEAAEVPARAAPARVEPRAALAAALVAGGDPAAAAREWEDLARIWPRDARIEKRRAEALDAAGDAAGARRARERALALDGSDLALRRALALEHGGEPLDDLAIDGAAAIAGYRAAAQREETSSVYVLDAAATEVHPDGSMTERVHQVVKVRDERAADRHGEVSLPPGAQVIALRTVKADGRVLEPEGGGADRPGTSLPGLEPGDYAEWEYLNAIPRRGAGLPGFTTDGFLLGGEVPLWHSRVVVRAPAGSGVEVEARGLPAPEVRREGGFEVVRAEARAVAPVLDEPSAPDQAEFLPIVRTGAGAGLVDLGRTHGDDLADGLRPTLELEALAREIAAGVPERDRGGEALLRAAYARTAGLVLGTGGSLGAPASQILARGRGSRAVLLAALYRALGVDARLALVRDYAKDAGPVRFPRGDLYVRPVLRVRHGGATVWLDPSQRLAPFGVLPPGARGQEALVLAAPGADAELDRTPEREPADPRDVDVRIAVAEDGSAVVDGVETYRGWEAAAAKAALERIDDAQRRQAVEGSLARSFRGAALEALAVDGEEDAASPLVLRWRARVPGWARLEDGRALVETPLFPARLGSHYASRARRETPLLVPGGEDARVRATVVPPAGFRALPRPREVVGAHGALRREERLDGAALVRDERFTLSRARIAPADYPGFAAFANAVDAAQAAPIVLERIPGA